LQTPSTIPASIGPDRDEELEPGGATQPILAVIVTTAVLYFARGILIPLAVASLLAVTFSPVAERLDRWVGRLASSALVVITAILLIVGVAYFLSVELTSAAVQITDYTDNIADKITTLGGSKPDWLLRIEYGIKDVQEQLQRPVRSPRHSTPSVVVQAPAAESDLSRFVSSGLPVLSVVIESLFVIVLFFFLLYGRKDLRDRLVRLAARARLTLSAEGIATAAGAVGRYLLLFSLTNIGYGLIIAAVTWLLGLPNPALWGALSAVLRFIPYVGVPVAALLPTFVAFAVFPGWSKSLEVLGSFVIVDLTLGNLVEPFLIGRGIGLSPLALLVSTMYWAWLWGLPGLFLATSLTACLKVAGDYIPALGFLAVLFGAEGKREDYKDYYRSLLELDVSGARDIAIHYCDKYGLEAACDDVLIPAVNLAGEERTESHISLDNQRLINDTTMVLVRELGDRFSKPRMTPRLRVLGVCAPNEVHRLGLQVLLELLRRVGVAANFLEEGKSPAEIRAFVNRYGPDVVFLSCTMIECVPAAAELVRLLRLDAPGLMIVCGGRGAVSEKEALLKAGASQVCETRKELRRAVRLYGVWGSASRFGASGQHRIRGKDPLENSSEIAPASSSNTPQHLP
jgi:predicted PurR-regulated permease PerM/methylmalonyl-CoA mutase cobalamin-binding subunit